MYMSREVGDFFVSNGASLSSEVRKRPAAETTAGEALTELGSGSLNPRIVFEG